jgi:hypothetical protein
MMGPVFDDDICQYFPDWGWHPGESWRGALAAIVRRPAVSVVSSGELPNAPLGVPGRQAHGGSWSFEVADVGTVIARHESKPVGDGSRMQERGQERPEMSSRYLSKRSRDIFRACSGRGGPISSRTEMESSLQIRRRMRTCAVCVRPFSSSSNLPRGVH